MRADTPRLGRTFFLPECSRTQRRRRTSACLWTASRERKLRRREWARRDPHDPGILTRNNRPAAGKFAHAAGEKCDNRNQRLAPRARGWRLAVHGVAMDRTTA